LTEIGFSVQVSHGCRKALHLKGRAARRNVQAQLGFPVDLACPRRGEEKPLVVRFLEMRIAMAEQMESVSAILVSQAQYTIFACSTYRHSNTPPPKEVFLLLYIEHSANAIHRLTFMLFLPEWVSQVL